MKAARQSAGPKIPSLRSLEAGWPASVYAQRIRDALRGRRSSRLELGSKATTILLEVLDKHEAFAKRIEQLEIAVQEKNVALAEALEHIERQRRATIELNKTANAREVPSPKSGLNLIEERNVPLVPKAIQGGAPR